MTKAVVDGVVVAESDETKVIEGNHYFPADSVKNEFFTESDLHTTCHWKGEASYFHIKTGKKTHENAAWTYPEPISERAEEIRDFVAFYSNVAEVTA